MRFDRRIRARAGPCTGPEAIAGCVALHKATDGRFVEEIHGVQGRWRCTEDVTSSPHTTSPQPGDHSPCLHCLSMQITVVCVSACVHASVRVHAYVRVWVCAMLVCGRQRGCGCACMDGSVCMRTCVLAHIPASIPELACSHDKRCTPNLSGCARRSGSRLRPNVWLFHVTVVWMGP